ncbi:MAG: hypothetical protein R2711_12800 [Acidimicrobiales bacterium]
MHQERGDRIGDDVPLGGAEHRRLRRRERRAERQVHRGRQGQHELPGRVDVYDAASGAPVGSKTIFAAANSKGV